MLTQERLKEVFNYDKETGVFTRKINLSSRFKIGSKVGSKCNYGYISICINYKIYKAHRLAWLYEYGTWPKNQIDHINGIRSDNRICNLREANNSENLQNQKRAQKDNKSTGLLGCSYHKRNKRFEACISINGKNKFLGSFKTAEEAHEKYLEAKRELHSFNTL